jgi:hypothetical protein
MPLALLLAFKLKMGLKGLWLGYTICTVVLDFGFAIIIMYPDWQKIAVKLRKSMEEEAIL